MSSSIASPVASNAAGTLTDPKQVARLAHDAGALAWADAVHYAPHGPIDAVGWSSKIGVHTRPQSSVFQMPPLTCAT